MQNYGHLVKDHYQPTVDPAKKDELINLILQPKSSFGRMSPHADPAAFVNNIPVAVKKSEFRFFEKTTLGKGIEVGTMSTMGGPQLQSKNKKLLDSTSKAANANNGNGALGTPALSASKGQEALKRSIKKINAANALGSSHKSRESLGAGL